MGTSIHLQPENIWQFFQKNKKRLSEEMVAIAENDETEYAVYLTEENGLPHFCVCKGNGAPEYEEGAINEQDCTDTAKKCCVQYLFPVTVTSRRGKLYAFDEDGGITDFDEQDQEDTIYQREDDLFFALYDFLNVVLQSDEGDTDAAEIFDQDSLETILDSILENLATDFGLPIYRPMMVEDETGVEAYTEYPYGEPEYEVKE